MATSASPSSGEEVTTLEQFKAALEEAKKNSGGPSNASLKLCPESSSVYLNILQEEFTCPICQGVFIEAIGLECSHLFCDECIARWRPRCEGYRRYPYFPCPVCRGPSMEIAPNNKIDVIIEQVMAIQPKEQQEERQVEKERREQNKKERPAAPPMTERQQVSREEMINFRRFFQDTLREMGELVFDFEEDSSHHEIEIPEEDLEPPLSDLDDSEL